MSAARLSMSGPWAYSIAEDRRFLVILVGVTALFAVAGGVVPYLHVPPLSRDQLEQVPPRLAKLILEKHPVKTPPPARLRSPKVPATRHTPETRKAPPKAAAKPAASKQAARDKAAKSGLLALKDELADLRDRPVAAALGKTRLHKSPTPPKPKTHAVIAAAAKRRSGDIDTSHLSRDSGKLALAGYSAARVDAPAGDDAVAQDTAAATRSLEEIQLVFDKNKGAIYTLYDRMLRRDPTLSGKVVLQLTIAPSGAVTACKVVSSELNSPRLLRKLVARVKFFKFPSRDVDTLVVTYPIDFLPSS